MTYYITKDASDNITGLYSSDNGNVPVDGIEVADADGELLRRGFAGYKHSAGVVVKDTTAELAAAVKKAVAGTYTDVDAIYAAAVGNRAPEYEQAEQAALAYQAAGYTGTASPYVADYAIAAGITDQQSADLIIARAAGLRAAAQSMRSQRFTSQKAMRDATTQAGLDVAVATWDAFIAQVRASLGL